MSELFNIIEKTTKQPTIINDKSNFVVVTYWWGRGNDNNNTARPCISFYETFIQRVIKLSVNTIKSIKKEKDIPNVVERLPNIVIKFEEFDNIMNRNIKEYQNEIYDSCGIAKNERNKDEKAIRILENLKTKGKTPPNFEYKDSSILKLLLTNICFLFINENKKNIFQLYYTNEEISKIKEKFINNKTHHSLTQIAQYKTKINELVNDKKTIQQTIKKSLNQKQNYNFEGIDTTGFQNLSIMQILIMELRYSNPLKYEDMIQKWENECTTHNCNFLSVEYPEFAKPGGYQLAINAKPLFIQKCLELCKDHNVLYIDGDMFIRKYPEIFDLPDVDFMARGWWIDPRSSYNVLESILYDPYTFETSGGTMFFSQSMESKRLIYKWVEESNKSYQQGKADDRILSLVFNTYKFLLNMKIIQLPVEYLWLSLDYDERMLEIFDYQLSKMQSSIYIEHPECLTSEDTATGAGASSDRTPKFYNFLENVYPVSEVVHEYLLFPQKEYVKSFDSYYDFMKNVSYYDDGNQDLYDQDFINKQNPSDNVQPLYIVPYDDKYGNSKIETSIGKYSFNEIVEMNNKKSDYGTIEFLNKDNTIIITSILENDFIPFVIKHLNSGKTIIYNPIHSDKYDAELYNVLIEKKDNLYHNLDFVFVPIINGFDFKYSFKPQIQINQVLLFRPNPILVKFLSMFPSLNDLSKYLNNGSYEFLSLLRIGFVYKKKKGTQGSTLAKSPLKTGGSNDANFMNKYHEGLSIMYGSSNSILPKVKSATVFSERKNEPKVSFYKTRRHFISKKSKNSRMKKTNKMKQRV
jgi:hypothetical protein